MHQAGDGRAAASDVRRRRGHSRGLLDGVQIGGRSRIWGRTGKRSRTGIVRVAPGCGVAPAHRRCSGGAQPACSRGRHREAMTAAAAAASVTGSESESDPTATVAPSRPGPLAAASWSDAAAFGPTRFVHHVLLDCLS